MGPRLRGDDILIGSARSLEDPARTSAALGRAHTRCSDTETFGPFLMVWYTTQ